MANTHLTLTSLFTDIANAIRNKTGSSATIKADNFPSAISDIPTGIDISDTTAVASDVLAGKNFYLADGTKTSGSIATKTSADLSVSGATVTASAGYYASAASKSVPVYDGSVS